MTGRGGGGNRGGRPLLTARPRPPYHEPSAYLFRKSGLPAAGPETERGEAHEGGAPSRRGRLPSWEAHMAAGAYTNPALDAPSGLRPGFRPTHARGLRRAAE